MARFVTCLLVLVIGAGSWAGLGGASLDGKAHSGALTTEPALASAIGARINVVRADHGLRPLRASPALGLAAASHSRDMAEHGYFRHESINGSAFWKRVSRYYGMAGFRTWQVGETLLWASPAANAFQIVRDWLLSPHHRAILLSGTWGEIGISAVHEMDAPGVYRGREVTIVTADFGVRSS